MGGVIEIWNTMDRMIKRKARATVGGKGGLYPKIYPHRTARGSRAVFLKTLTITPREKEERQDDSSLKGGERWNGQAKRGA